mmetsp:Transcript_38101/g.89780  ORF Transcript_38101/g.89780 Transcript_38101/m.89780 type:complete len:285 (+) Transcript_38101:2297-3151(+)
MLRLQLVRQLDDLRGSLCVLHRGEIALLLPVLVQRQEGEVEELGASELIEVRHTVVSGRVTGEVGVGKVVGERLKLELFRNLGLNHRAVGAEVFLLVFAKVGRVDVDLEVVHVRLQNLDRLTIVHLRHSRDPLERHVLSIPKLNLVIVGHSNDSGVGVGDVRHDARVRVLASRVVDHERGPEVSENLPKDASDVDADELDRRGLGPAERVVLETVLERGVDHDEDAAVFEVSSIERVGDALNLHRRVELLELAQARLRSVRADVRLSNVVLRREVPQRCWLGVM